MNIRLRFIALLYCCDALAASAGEQPNVVFVITDDQGYGDLGFTGNPIIQTPHMDQLAKESLWLEDYHVAPSCSPTRCSLLTGRWTNRTGVWHTFFARAMMYADEVTITSLQWIDALPPWNQGVIRKSSLANPKGRTKAKAKANAPQRYKGHWVVKDGEYVFEDRRWPAESGLKICEGVKAHPAAPGCLPGYSAVPGTALPVVPATLRIDGKDLETKPVSPDDQVIRFTHELPAGSYQFSPWFSVETAKGGENSEIGCYYLTVKPLIQ